MMRYLLVFSLIFMLSCGKSNNSKKKVVEITQDQVLNLLEKQVFICESLNGNECPDALVRLFILNSKNPNQSGLCSGFLTRSNRLITNAHCVSKIEECYNTYAVVHIGGSYRVARCQNILKTFEAIPPLNYGTIQFNYREAQRKSKVPYSGTHILRHGMAKLARQIGGGLDAVIAMTGHKDLKLADHYSKCNEDDQRHFSEKIMEHIRNNTRKDKVDQASFSNVVSLNSFKKANNS